MKTYITKEQAATLAERYALPDGLGKPNWHVIFNAAIQHYRDSLVAGVVLPEPVAYFYHDAGSAETANPLLHSTMFLHRSERRQNLRNETPLYTADQLRQAIADALCVAEKETAELRLYKHNMEARFKGLNSMLKYALEKQVPQGYKLVPETPTNDMTVAMANALEDPENERSSWDLAENMYAAMLAAAPDPKDTK